MPTIYEVELNKMNCKDCINEICDAAGIDQEIKCIFFSGRKEPDMPKKENNTDTSDLINCEDCKNVMEDCKSFQRKPAGIDIVNHPPHYTGAGIECIEAMSFALGEDAVVAFCLCNCFKYLWRHKDKNGTEDLKKAKWYLDKADSLVSSDTDYGYVEDIRRMRNLYAAVVNRENYKSD